jgi:hypothetical protein
MLITTQFVHEGDETFELDASQESELLAAIAEADRGELIDATELLKQIRELSVDKRKSAR